MGAFITGFIALIGVIPQVVSIVSALMKFIHEEVEAAERKKFAKDIKEAVHAAVQTKDTSRLEKIFGGGPSGPGVGGTQPSS